MKVTGTNLMKWSTTLRCVVVWDENQDKLDILELVHGVINLVCVPFVYILNVAYVFWIVKFLMVPFFSYFHVAFGLKSVWIFFF